MLRHFDDYRIDYGRGRKIQERCGFFQRLGQEAGSSDLRTSATDPEPQAAVRDSGICLHAAPGSVPLFRVPSRDVRAWRLRWAAPPGPAHSPADSGPGNPFQQLKAARIGQRLQDRGAAGAGQAPWVLDRFLSGRFGFLCERTWGPCFHLPDSSYFRPGSRKIRFSLPYAVCSPPPAASGTAASRALCPPRTFALPRTPLFRAWIPTRPR